MRTLKNSGKADSIFERRDSRCSYVRSAKLLRYARPLVTSIAWRPDVRRFLVADDVDKDDSTCVATSVSEADGDPLLAGMITSITVDRSFC